MDRSGVEGLLDRLRLDHLRNALPRRLSGGETARAGLAAALAGQPDVLLADEPTAEVSSAEEATMLELIRTWRPPNGATVLVTHSEAVARTADRVVQLRDGRQVNGWN
jgi:putative ABC transport system ATP-binding protein